MQKRPGTNVLLRLTQCVQDPEGVRGAGEGVGGGGGAWGGAEFAHLFAQSSFLSGQHDHRRICLPLLMYTHTHTHA